MLVRAASFLPTPIWSLRLFTVSLFTSPALSLISHHPCPEGHPALGHPCQCAWYKQILCLFTFFNKALARTDLSLSLSLSLSLALSLSRSLFHSLSLSCSLSLFLSLDLSKSSLIFQASYISFQKKPKFSKNPRKVRLLFKKDLVAHACVLQLVAICCSVYHVISESLCRCTF